jgi:hypothetical protein
MPIITPKVIDLSKKTIYAFYEIKSHQSKAGKAICRGLLLLFAIAAQSIFLINIASKTHPLDGT